MPPEFRSRNHTICRYDSKAHGPGPRSRFRGAGREAGNAMSIEIDVLNGDASWPLVEPLFTAVWPPDVVAKLPWVRFAFAYPEWRGGAWAAVGGGGGRAPLPPRRPHHAALRKRARGRD